MHYAAIARSEVAESRMMSTVSLLLFLLTIMPLTLLGGQRAYTCNQQEIPANCQSNPNIETLKGNETYQLRLCPNDQCREDSVTLNFRCCYICEVCETLLASGTWLIIMHKMTVDLIHTQCYTVGCGQNEGQCEETVDMFLNNYCASVSFELPAIHIPPIAPTQTILLPMPTAIDLSYFQSITVTIPNKTCTPNQSMGNSSDSRNIIILALGIILGLCVVLLLVVTAGWVCTCRALRTQKRKPVKNTLEEQR